MFIATSLKQNDCIPANLPSKKKVGHWAKAVCIHITKNQKNPQSWVSGLLGIREGFS